MNATHNLNLESFLYQQANIHMAKMVDNVILEFTKLQSFNRKAN